MTSQDFILNHSLKRIFRFVDLRKIQGVGEDLAAAGVADSSVDAVVMTLVLCTVEDQIKWVSR